MVQTCRHCQRLNPREASYCHFDGNILDRHGEHAPTAGSPVNLAIQSFTVPLVFPSGLRCENFQQLAEASHREPAAAGELLRQGFLAQFFAGQGRVDLAACARAAAQAPNGERGLDDLLGRLPFLLPPAWLKVQPGVIDAGTVHVGEDRSFQIVLQNGGMRLLYGSAACAAPWIALGEVGTQSSMLFQLTDQAVLPVRVVGNRLRAFDKPQEAEIVVESCGGSQSIRLRVLVAVKPFPQGVLAGALSPRQLAKQAHDAPKEAAALIENGAVAQWYRDNGWTYPVPGPCATGIAAVQQLFEALGLVKPPKVETSEDAIHLRGRPGDELEHTLAVITRENRAAIAHGTSNQPWLQVGNSIFRGRSAFLPLRIARVPVRNGETLHAVVSVTANGGQRFEVPLTLTVEAPILDPVGAVRHEAPQPVAAVQFARSVPPPSPTPVTAAHAPVATAVQARVATALPVAAVRRAPAQALDTHRRALFVACLPALLLIAVVLGAAVHDYLAPEHRTMLTDLGHPVDATPRLQIRFHDVTRNDVLDDLYLPDHQGTMRFGLVMLRGGKEIGTGIQARRLTFDPWGRTNNTCVRFDQTDERLFGSGARGHWEQSEANGWTDEQGRKHDGTKSVWIWDDTKVEVSQLVEMVRGPQSGLFDTCRVRYLLTNRDDRVHEIGIRFLLDTFIGGNDGVPFTIPGEPDLCDTMKDLPSQARDRKIPDFLEALEKPDLAHPGTIAHLRLKLEDLETPERVTLGAWPSEKLRVLDRKAAGPLTLWDVPVLPLQSLGLNDSAVTIYWADRPLAPAATRAIGFEYGLGNLASNDSALATIVDGAFRPHGQLTVVAYVNRSAHPADDATVTLSLPEGFHLVAGAATQTVPRLPPASKSANVPVTWIVQAGPNGAYEFHVTSSFGLAQTLKVAIRESIF